MMTVRPFTLVLVVALTTTLLSACGGSSSGGVYNQAFNVSGQWTGAMSDSTGAARLVSMTLSDGGGTVTGTISVTGHACISGGNLTGTAVQAPANTTGDNPLTGDQENSNQGTVELSLSGLASRVESITVDAAGSGYTQDTDVIIGVPDLSNGIQATATVTTAGGIIEGFVITESGNGYIDPPPVTIVDQDTQGVLSITVILGGKNYQAATTTVAIAPPDISTGITAKAKAQITNGEITGFGIARAGSGYTKVPKVTITDSGGGFGADGLAVLNTFTGGEGGVATATLVEVATVTLTLSGTSSRLSGYYQATGNCGTQTQGIICLSRAGLCPPST